ncbi:MAG TPA: tetratricopeptide repeat protein [Candidatus Polarisedimenticolia bacterium]|nr:tetratricopeptide repeat protein [Candidatus Polarisedimenticolia bacterium]
MNDCRRQFAFGPFVLDPVAHDLLRDGQAVPLTPKAFDVLLVLVQNHGRLLDKEELIRAVWPDTFVEEGNLYVMVSILRKVFGEHGYIHTVPKHGYRFVGEITLLPVEEALGPEENTVPAPAPHEAVTRRGSNSELAVLTFRVACVVAVVGGILLTVGIWSRTEPTIHGVKRSEIRSLAVLPFETMGASTGDENLGLGMADALITKLDSAGQVTTRPTRAIQKYQNIAQDPRAVGREQNVDAVLDGSIQRSTDRVRVTARLIRVGDGVQLWSDTFEEQFTSFFAVEDAVSARVAGSIQAALTGEPNERLAKRPASSGEAYQAYLRGRYFWNERTSDGLKKGLNNFRRAIELDPGYPEAYAGIADSYAMLGLYTVLPPNEAFPKAKAAAIHALELDSTLAEAHATLGFVHFYYDWDGAAAEKEFASALQGNPHYAMAHSWRGFNLAVMGRLSEAIREATLAQTDDPLSAIVGTNAAWVYFLARQNDKAIETLESVIEMDPNFPRAHFRLGNIYEHQGQYDRAIAEYEKAVQLSAGDTYYEASLGHAYAMSGMVAEAEKSLQHLEEQSARRYVPPYGIALIYLGMGNKHHGLEWLERASADRSTSMAYLRVDPTLNSLRSEPRFASLVKQTNF